MPKLKTHKGLRARVRVTRRGKVMRRRPGKRHLMSSKNAKRRRKLSGVSSLHGRIAKTAARSLRGG
jgi:large subunit ribosomal protein L35